MVISRPHVTPFPSLVLPISKTSENTELEMTREMDTLKGLGLEEATIVSFDIPQEDMTRRRLVHRFIHGRSETRSLNGEERTYTYPGLMDEGGFRMGQSVYLFPPHLASRLILRLRELKIGHRFWDVFMRP
jgi:hypothetical protein